MSKPTYRLSLYDIDTGRFETVKGSLRLSARKVMEAVHYWEQWYDRQCSILVERNYTKREREQYRKELTEKSTRRLEK